MKNPPILIVVPLLTHAVRLAAFCLLLCGNHASASEQTVVVPIEYANREGDLSFGDVFNQSYNTVRYQQVYDASEFQNLSGDIIQITGVRFRVDGRGVGSFDVVLPRVEIRLSTSANSPVQMSRVFSENVGPDNSVVYPEAPLKLTGQGLGLSPQPFNVEIRFEQAFWYDPRAGHLLLDILRPGDGFSIVFPFDLAYDKTGYAISTYNNPTATVLRNNTGLATQFIFNAVPEPSIVAIGFLGLAFVLLKRKCI